MAPAAGCGAPAAGIRARVRRPIPSTEGLIGLRSRFPPTRTSPEVELASRRLRLGAQRTKQRRSKAEQRRRRQSIPAQTSHVPFELAPKWECRLTDMPIACRHRQLKVGREDTPRRQTARATLAVPPRQARQLALNSSNGLSGSGVCYTAGSAELVTPTPTRDAYIRSASI
jgi:hypothetical protein